MRQNAPFSLAAFFKLVRWPNLLLLAFTQYMVRIFLIADTYNPADLLKSRIMAVIAASTCLIAAAGYIINDYYDVKIDIVNKPGRVIVGRSLKRQYALALHGILSFGGVLLSILTLNKWVFVCCILSVFMLWFYSNMLKRTALAGNILVALLTALSIWMPAIYYPHNRKVVFAFALYAFFISLIRELIKDMEDLRGDARFGAKTLPVVWGFRRSKYVVYLVSGLFTVSLFYAAHKLSLYLGLYFGLLMAPLAYLLYLLYSADTRKKFSALSLYFKILMLLGVLSMAFL